MLSSAHPVHLREQADAFGMTAFFEEIYAGVRDKTERSRTLMKLPDERNGVAMVFRTFDRVSYALLLEIRNGVRVGDRLVNPR